MNHNKTSDGALIYKNVRDSYVFICFRDRKSANGVG